VLSDLDDSLTYADVDHHEIYSNGPLAYKVASLQRKIAEKQTDSEL